MKTAVEVTPVTGPVRTIGTCTMPVSGVLKMGAPKLMLVWISLTLIVVVEGVPSVAPVLGFVSVRTMVSRPSPPYRAGS